MADALTVTSRNFFERTKAKLVASLVVGSASLMLLGFCSYSGGTAANFQTNLAYYKKNNVNDDYRKNQLTQLSGGYGFAAFCYIVAFVILAIAAIYVSPLICGSNNEKKMISRAGPQEIDTGYSAYNPEASKSEV